MLGGESWAHDGSIMQTCVCYVVLGFGKQLFVDSSTRVGHFFFSVHVGVCMVADVGLPHHRLAALSGPRFVGREHVLVSKFCRDFSRCGVWLTRDCLHGLFFAVFALSFVSLSLVLLLLFFFF